MVPHVLSARRTIVFSSTNIKKKCAQRVKVDIFLWSAVAFFSDLWHQLILLDVPDTVSTRMNQEAFVSAPKAGLQ